MLVKIRSLMTTSLLVVALIALLSLALVTFIVFGNDQDIEGKTAQLVQNKPLEQTESAPDEKAEITGDDKVASEDKVTVEKADIASAEDGLREFVPHIAVYELELDGLADRANHILNAKGKLVYQLSGDACEGFATKFRFVLDFQSDDHNVLSDYRMTSFEMPGSEEFQFVSQSFSNEVLDGETKGSAALSGDRLKIELRQPEPEKVEREKALFPVLHTASILQAAREGEKFYRSNIFDGAHQGTEIFFTQAVIGKPQVAGDESFGEEDTPPWENLAPWLKGKTYWPVNVTYFQDTDAGNSEKEPFYTASFRLFENGVSTHLRLDYVDFVLKGTTTRLDNEGSELGKAQSCS